MCGVGDFAPTSLGMAITRSTSRPFDIPRRIQYPQWVRTRAISQLLLFALLAFQVAFGLQQSAGVPHPESARYTAAAHNEHHDLTQRADSTAGSITAAASDGACPLHAPAPDNKHDCCKSSCQCQCGYVSLGVNLGAPKGIPASTQVQPITAARFTTAPAETLFRPPIRA
jgi:hypothetical protein